MTHVHEYVYHEYGNKTFDKWKCKWCKSVVLIKRGRQPIRRKKE